jgi:membrane-bound lytic murein transglycosylase MltF
VRKNSPKLLAVLNPLIKANSLGSAFGNTLTAKYLKNVKYVKNATSQAEIAKFRKMVDAFRKYGQTYDMDFLLMMAQGYQESRLDNNAKSQVGAIGVMQVMPATGKELAVGDIKREENNIHAGVKYMRFVRDEFFEDQPMDDLNKALFAFASATPALDASASSAARPKRGPIRTSGLATSSRSRRSGLARNGRLREQHLQSLAVLP